MKKKFLAMALSSALLAMVVMPSAYATGQNAGTLGQVTDDTGITMTPENVSFALPSISSIALTDETGRCFYTPSEIGTANRFFTVTDTDTSNTHYIKVDGESDADASDDGYLSESDTAGTDLEIGKIGLSLESASATTCTAGTDQTRTVLVTKVAGGGTVANVALTKGWEAGSNQTYLPLTGSAQTILTGSNTTTLQYKFRVGTLRILYPQYGKANTYTTTMVFSYATT